MRMLVGSFRVGLLGVIALACSRERPDAAMPAGDSAAGAPFPVLVPPDSTHRDRVPPDTATAASQATAPSSAPAADTSGAAIEPGSDTALKPNIDPRPAGSLPRIPREGAATP